LDTPRRSTQFGRYLPIALTATDWLIVNAMFALALWLMPVGQHEGPGLRTLWILINVSYLPALLWQRRRRMMLRAIQLDRVVLRTLGVVGMHALFFLSFNAFLGFSVLEGKQYLLYYGLLTVVLELWSLLSHLAIKQYRRRGYNFTRVAIVGTNDTARRLYEAMHHDSGYGYRVMSFFATEPVAEFCGVECHPIWELEHYARAMRLDQIYYTVPGRDELITPVVRIADDCVAEFFYVPQISRYISRGFELHSIGAVPVLTIVRNPLSLPFNSMLKRAFDLVFSSLVLCLYPLVYIPVAIAIKLSSPGPVYFKQKRTGYRGREFTCLKFRTMQVNVDADRAQATENDPRKTRLGDFLRRTSIDELPQFINVWRGDMSVVGPRPHMLKHTEDYKRLVDRYMLRHLIKPGITGWAQVNGYRGATDELWKMERRVENDVWYIEHWSLTLDLKIIVRTVINAFAGEKNAF